MKVIGHAATDAGPQREINQDRVYVDNDFGLYIVCDGMGGHAAGDLAADMAIEKVCAYLSEHRSELEDISPKSPSDTQVLSIVEDAVVAASKAVFDKAESERKFQGMGTTITLLLIRNNSGLLAHVGDSRLYLQRNNEFHQLTRDHTYVQEMIDRGGMTPEEARNSPYAHVLTRALGVLESIPVDTLRFELAPGDRMLLCSDGVYDAIDLENEVSGASADNTEEAVSFLIRRSCESNAQDNVGAVVVDIAAEAAEEEQAVAFGQEAQLKIETLQQVYMFRDLDLQSLVRVVDKCKVSALQSGDTVCRQGEEGQSLFIVLSGELQVAHEETNVATIGRGNHVGEMSILSGAPRSATVTAVSDCRLLELENSDFRLLVQEDPITGVNLLYRISQELCTRLRATNAMVR